MFYFSCVSKHPTKESQTGVEQHEEKGCKRTEYSSLGELFVYYTPNDFDQ